MNIQAVKCELADIKHLRELFLHEANFQFVHNKCHLYGWADTYRLMLNDVLAGYGSVWGEEKREDRDCIFEFYLLPPYRQYASAAFAQLIAASKVPFIECQTNDALLSSMVFEFTKNINAGSILFHDSYTSTLAIPGAILKPKLPADPNPHNREFELEHHGVVVASGGFLMNYNHPYADIYMDVHEDHRKKGYGSFIVQELKREIYIMGKVPAARCNVKNGKSKSTLLKAGFGICGHWLKGEVKDNFKASPTSI